MQRDLRMLGFDCRVVQDDADQDRLQQLFKSNVLGNFQLPLDRSLERRTVFTQRTFAQVRPMIMSGDAVLCRWTNLFGTLVRLGMQLTHETAAFAHVGIFVRRKDLPIYSRIAPPLQRRYDLPTGMRPVFGTSSGSNSSNEDALFIYDTGALMPAYVDARWNELANGAQLRRTRVVFEASEVCAWLPLDMNVRLRVSLASADLERVLCKYQGTPYVTNPVSFASIAVPELRPLRRAMDTTFAGLIMDCCPGSWCSALLLGDGNVPNGQSRTQPREQMSTAAVSEAALYGYRTAIQDMQNASGDRGSASSGKQKTRGAKHSRRRQGAKASNTPPLPRQTQQSQQQQEWSVCSELVARIYSDLGVFGEARVDCTTVAPCDFLPKGYGDDPKDMLDCRGVEKTCDKDRQVPWIFSQVVLFNP